MRTYPVSITVKAELLQHQTNAHNDDFGQQTCPRVCSMPHISWLLGFGGSLSTILFGGGISLTAYTNIPNA